MPWRVEESESRCSASEPWAVVNEANDETEGCHATEEEAQAHMRALYANVEESNKDSSTASNVTVNYVFNGNGVDDDVLKLADEEQPGRWKAVLMLEEERTDDLREFEAGAITWREPPLPLMVMVDNDEGHMDAIIAGKIEHIWREGNLIMGEGSFDLGGDNGREAARLVQEGILRWVSADLASGHYELLFEGDCEVEDDDEIVMFLGPPEGCEVIAHFDQGKIMGATILPFPAFENATIEAVEALTAALEPIDAGLTRFQSQPLPLGETFAVDNSEWDGNRAMGQCDSAADYRKICAGEHTTGEPDQRQHWALPHHYLGRHPDPNAAGVRNALSRLPQTQNLESAEAARAHLERHMSEIQAASEAAIAEETAMTASIPVDPPAEWFKDPELAVPTPLTVTDDGRVFGHAFLWNVCHTGRDDVCLMAPKSQSRYAYFRTGAVKADGSEDSIPTGPITLNGGHAKLSGLSASEAQAHYDETRSAVADVAVGEDEHGGWFAGALRPGVTDEQVRVLRGSVLSGDWRMIAGHLELIALCAVNVPGFPVPRALVASGEVTALVAAGSQTLAKRKAEPWREEVQTLRMRVEVMEAEREAERILEQVIRS